MKGISVAEFFSWKNLVEEMKRLTIRPTSRSLWRGGPAR
jgi:hypothetical protein